MPTIRREHPSEKIRLISSYAAQGAFAIALAMAYVAIAGGLSGLFEPSSAYLMTLIGCGVGCVAGLVNVLIYQRDQ